MEIVAFLFCWRADETDLLSSTSYCITVLKYLTTLGGIKTTLSHPVSSSHYGVPEEIRLKMGITEGLIRVSVGVEDIDDLLGDFYQALEVFA